MGRCRNICKSDNSLAKTCLLSKAAFQIRSSSLTTRSKYLNGTTQCAIYTSRIIGFSSTIQCLSTLPYPGLQFAMNALAGGDGWIARKQMLYQHPIIHHLHFGRELFHPIGRGNMNLNQGNLRLASIRLKRKQRVKW